MSIIKNIGANDAAYIAIIMPLIALIISTIFEGLIWDMKLYVGAFLVLFGNMRRSQAKSIIPIYIYLLYVTNGKVIYEINYSRCRNF